MYSFSTFYKVSHPSLSKLVSLATRRCLDELEMYFLRSDHRAGKQKIAKIKFPRDLNFARLNCRWNYSSRFANKYQFQTRREARRYSGRDGETPRAQVWSQFRAIVCERRREDVKLAKRRWISARRDLIFRRRRRRRRHFSQSRRFSPARKISPGSHTWPPHTRRHAGRGYPGRARKVYG